MKTINESEKIQLSTHASFLVRGGERRTNYNCQIYGRGREQLAGGETVVKRERESETENSSGEAGRSFSTLLLPGAGRGSTSCVPERLLQRCLEETLFTTSAVLLYSPHTNTTTTVALVVTLWGAQIIHSERPGNGG